MIGWSAWILKAYFIATVLTVLLFSVTAHADGILTWTANTEADLSGYKVYRGNINCTAPGPLQFLASIGKVTTYTDTTVPKIDGTVCWEITALDTAGNESGPSNRVSKVLNTLPPLAPAGLSVAIQ